MPPRRRSQVADPHVLTPQAMELVARNFRALADPSRLHILHALEGGEAAVQALAAATSLGSSALSRHLQHLHRVGLVRRRRDGLFVFYALADRNVLRLCELMCGRVEREVAKGTAAFAR